MSYASILCIPGRWRTRSDFVKDLAVASDGACLAAGLMIAWPQKNIHCEWDFDSRGPAIERSFEIGLQGRTDAQEVLGRVVSCQGVVYLLSKTSSQQAVDDIAQLAVWALRAGGVAVSTEASGRAFGSESWVSLAEGGDYFPSLVWHLVTDENGHFFSAGMTAFGLPDTVIETTQFELAVDTVRAFESYQLHEAPDLREGQTFGVADGAPIWRLSKQAHPYDDPDTELDRSPGAWRLSPG